MINAKTGTSQGLQGQLGQLPRMGCIWTEDWKRNSSSQVRGKGRVLIDKESRLCKSWKHGRAGCWAQISLQAKEPGAHGCWKQPLGQTFRLCHWVDRNEEARQTLLTHSKSRYPVLARMIRKTSRLLTSLLSWEWNVSYDWDETHRLWPQALRNTAKVMEPFSVCIEGNCS